MTLVPDIEFKVHFKNLLENDGMYIFIIINPRLLLYRVPQPWITLQFQMHTLTHKKTHKQDSKQKVPISSHFRLPELLNYSMIFLNWFRFG